ncbi:DciA family protein [Pleionea sediminis]|uniref:DciA family protein n=1 Tax=Pleionea sediminis TaxID=2569479 RepID=UPI001186B060|nr:DciA family protein [Pleionea sediminis]
MKKPSPESLTSISDKAEGSLRYILDNLAKIKQLDQIVKAKLNKNLTPHCRVANYRDNRIVIAADSSSWATRLKFELPNLLSNLRAEGFAGLQAIDVIISEKPQK